LTGRTDDVASLNLIAAFNLKLSRVSVGRYVVVGVAHEDQIAELLEAATSIDHDPVVGRRDAGALWDGNGDALVFFAARLTTKARYDFPMDGPVENRSGVRSSIG